MSRTGKIARLPLAVREELNHRLADGRPGPEILPWLNALPDVVVVLTTDFGGAPINAQNLSDWRHGGFEDWQKSKDRFHTTRLLAERAAELARAAGGNLAEGSAALLSGRLLELMEKLGDDTPVEDLALLIKSVATLRDGDIGRQRAEQDRQKIAQKDEELALAREKFQLESAETALRIVNDARAREIEAAPGSHADKLELMGRHIFGDLWQGKSPAAPAPPAHSPAVHSPAVSAVPVDSPAVLP
jgi:hypothetical protein